MYPSLLIPVLGAKALELAQLEELTFEEGSDNYLTWVNYPLYPNLYSYIDPLSSVIYWKIGEIILSCPLNIHVENAREIYRELYKMADALQD